jgi:hypothetical protein
LDGLTFPYAASHMRDEIAKWSGQPNFIQTIENTKTYDYWDKSIHSVQPWMEKTRRDLSALRQKYAAADVYEVTQQPLKRKYFAIDIEARIKAIDAIDAAIVKMYEIEKEASAFANQIGIQVQQGTAPDALLKSYRQILVTAGAGQAAAVLG